MAWSSRRQPDARPSSTRRGYGGSWRRARAAALADAQARQHLNGRLDPDDPDQRPYCECCANCPERADTVDHWRPRRTFPIQLQGSTGPGGSDHHGNLRPMSHSHHSQRREDKAR